MDYWHAPSLTVSFLQIPSSFPLYILVHPPTATSKTKRWVAGGANLHLREFIAGFSKSELKVCIHSHNIYTLVQHLVDKCNANILWQMPAIVCWILCIYCQVNGRMRGISPLCSLWLCKREPRASKTGVGYHRGNCEAYCWARLSEDPGV